MSAGLLFITEILRVGDLCVVHFRDDGLRGCDEPFDVKDDWCALGRRGEPHQSYTTFPGLTDALRALAALRPELARELSADLDQLAYALTVAFPIGRAITSDPQWDDIEADGVRARDFPVPYCDGDDVVFHTWSHLPRWAIAGRPRVERHRFSLATFDWVRP